MAGSNLVGIENGKFGSYNFNKDNEKEFNPLGNAVYVIGIRQYEEESMYELELKYEYNNTQHQLYLPRADLNRKSLLELSGKGIDALEHTVATLIKVIQQQEAKYLENIGEIQYLHKRLGWHNVQVDNQIIKVFKHYNLDDEFQSQYYGSFDIQPKGTLEGWSKNVKDEIIGYTPAETILVLALSSVLVGYMGVEAACENLIFHLVGDSSSGKTTMAYLAIATAGNPAIGSNSLLRSWGSTRNAIITSRIGNYGVPMVLDEISMFKGHDLSDLVYTLSTGCDKDRLDKDCQLKSRDSFLTTTLSTGEGSLLSKCKNNTGLKIRVIELKAVWTKSAENSERIKQNSLANYGFASQELAKTVKNKGIDELLERLEYWKNVYKERTKVSDFVDRMSIKYGIILLTAELINETFDFDVNIDEILKFLINNEYDNSSNRDLGLEAYNKLIAYIHMNRNHFIEVSKSSIKNIVTQDVQNTSLWGKIENVRKKKLLVNDVPVVEEVSLYRDKFSEIIKELGFEDDKILLDKLKAKKLLNCESGRYYRKRKLFEGGTVEHVYVFNVLEEEADDETTVEESRNKGVRRQKPLVNSKAKNLLLEDTNED
jgi:hypothetical protein